MLLRNTFYTFPILVICLFSCQTKKSKKLDYKYQSLYEEATDKYKYGDLDGSHLTFLELLSISDGVSPSKENQRIHLITLIYLGDITLKAGAKDLAYQEFEKALTLAEEYGNEDYQIQAILNKASLENDPVKLDSLLDYANKKFAYNPKNKYSLSQIQYGLGLLFAKNEQTSKALQIFYDLLGNETIADQDKVELYKGIGIAYKNRKDFKSAIEYFDTALQLVEDKTIMELKVLVEKAEIYCLNKQYNKFKILIEKKIPVIDNLKDLTIKRKINLLQINICDQKNDFYGKAEKLSELNALDELIDEKSKTLLVSIASNLKNLELIKEKKTQEAKSRYLKILLVLTVLLFASIITSLILFYHHIKSALKAFNEFINGEWAAKKRIAGQLHDILATHLATIRLEFILLKKDLPSDKYEKLLNMQSETLEELRHIIYDIMPPTLENGGLITAINNKIELWNNEILHFNITSNIDEVDLYEDLKFALYACVLECINNIVKYANATEVIIDFSLNKYQILEISISDNGIGFDTNKINEGKGGLGIRGMESRIEYFKGKFNIHSKQREGTNVSITVPTKQSISFSLTKRLSKFLKAFYFYFFRKDSIQDISKSQ